MGGGGAGSIGGGGESMEVSERVSWLGFDTTCKATPQKEFVISFSFLIKISFVLFVFFFPFLFSFNSQVFNLCA